MNDIKALETTNTEIRAEWVKPVVQSISAGDAEAGFGGGEEDVPYSFS